MAFPSKIAGAKLLEKIHRLFWRYRKKSVLGSLRLLCNMEGGKRGRGRGTRSPHSIPMPKPPDKDAMDAINKEKGTTASYIAEQNRVPKRACLLLFCVQFYQELSVSAAGKCGFKGHSCVGCNFYFAQHHWLIRQH